MRQARDLPSRAASPSWRKTVLAAIRSGQLAKASIPTLPRSALCQSVIRWWNLKSHWPKVYPLAILICRNLRFSRAKSQILSDTSTRSRKSDSRRNSRRSTVRGTAILRWRLSITINANFEPPVMAANSNSSGSATANSVPLRHPSQRPTNIPIASANPVEAYHPNDQVKCRLHVATGTAKCPEATGHSARRQSRFLASQR